MLASNNSHIRVTSTPQVIGYDTSAPIAPVGVSKTGSVYQMPLYTYSTANLSKTSTSALSDLVFTYYEQISAKQNVAPGSYVDTVVVQVSF